ncbi:MAG: hypothetical protein ACYST6_09385 [Planctomycetota bacterium]|jgi:opacity protein-like surface antigen
MKTGFGTLFLTAFLFSVSIAWPAYAQGQQSSSDGWDIYLMPYVWFAELESDSTLSGLEGSAELSLCDIIDYLDFAASGRVEAWNKNKWGLTFDGLYLNVGADDGFEGSRGLVDFRLDADIRLGMADFGFAYRLFDERFGDNNEQKLTFEPYGGLRYTYLRQKVKLEQDIPGIGSAEEKIGDSQDWVEPFVGGRIRWDLNERLALTIRGDAGGFGIGSASKLTWNLVPGGTYKLSENVTFEAGYRILDIDYSRGSGTDKFAIDARAEGPIFGVTILF